MFDESPEIKGFSLHRVEGRCSTDDVIPGPIQSEYWKSQPRKYCEFCKCWIAENKPSIDFHEKGKRHQENVKNKIDHLKKKSLRDAKAQEEVDSDMKKMERDALAALKRDLENDPSMAAVYGVKIKEKVHTVEPKPEGYEADEPVCEPSSTPVEGEDMQDKSEVPGQCDWDEATSPEGYTYYWNKVTGETTWEKPESYIPPSERKVKKKKKKKKVDDVDVIGAENVEKGVQETPSSVSLEPSEKPTDVKSTQVPPTISADPTRSVIEIPMPGDISAIPMPGDPSVIPMPGEVKEKTPEPINRPPRPNQNSAYGSWETVTYEEEPLIDYQLPKSNITAQEVEAAPVDTSYPEPPKIKFREKRVAGLTDKPGQKTGIVFKKRKIGGAASNIRKRDDD